MSIYIAFCLKSGETKSQRVRGKTKWRQSHRHLLLSFTCDANNLLKPRRTSDTYSLALPKPMDVILLAYCNSTISSSSFNFSLTLPCPRHIYCLSLLFSPALPKDNNTKGRTGVRSTEHIQTKASYHVLFIRGWHVRVTSPESTRLTILLKLIFIYFCWEGWIQWMPHVRPSLACDWNTHRQIHSLIYTPQSVGLIPLFPFIYICIWHYPNSIH